MTRHPRPPRQFPILRYPRQQHHQPRSHHPFPPRFPVLPRRMRSSYRRHHRQQYHQPPSHRLAPVLLRYPRPRHRHRSFHPSRQHPSLTRMAHQPNRRRPFVPAPQRQHPTVLLLLPRPSRLEPGLRWWNRTEPDRESCRPRLLLRQPTLVRYPLLLLPGWILRSRPRAPCQPAHRPRRSSQWQPWVLQRSVRGRPGEAGTRLLSRRRRSPLLGPRSLRPTSRQQHPWGDAPPRSRPDLPSRPRPNRRSCRRLLLPRRRLVQSSRQQPVAHQPLPSGRACLIRWSRAHRDHPNREQDRQPLPRHPPHRFDPARSRERCAGRTERRRWQGHPRPPPLLRTRLPPPRPQPPLLLAGRRSMPVDRHQLPLLRANRLLRPIHLFSHPRPLQQHQ